MCCFTSISLRVIITMIKFSHMPCLYNDVKIRYLFSLYFLSFEHDNSTLMKQIRINKKNTLFSFNQKRCFLKDVLLNLNLSISQRLASQFLFNCLSLLRLLNAMSYLMREDNANFANFSKRAYIFSAVNLNMAVKKLLIPAHTHTYIYVYILIIS